MITIADIKAELKRLKIKGVTGKKKAELIAMLPADHPYKGKKATAPPPAPPAAPPAPKTIKIKRAKPTPPPPAPKTIKIKKAKPIAPQPAAPKEPSAAEKVMFNMDLLRKIGGYKKDLELFDKLRFVEKHFRLFAKLMKDYENKFFSWGTSKHDSNQSLHEFSDFLQSYMQNDLAITKKGEKHEYDYNYFIKFWENFFDNLAGRGDGELEYSDRNGFIDTPVSSKNKTIALNGRFVYLMSGVPEAIETYLLDIANTLKKIIDGKEKFGKTHELEKQYRDNEYYSALPIQFNDLDWLIDMFPENVFHMDEEIEFDDDYVPELDEDGEEYEDQFQPYYEIIYYRIEPE